MTLLDRYLKAVRLLLPPARRDAAFAELSATLRTQVADRERQLGRPLTEEEQAELLKPHGHPAIAASRDRSRPPLALSGFLPVYLFALKSGLAVALIVTLVLAIVPALEADDPVERLVNGLLAYPGRALAVFAWTTVGFAAVAILYHRLSVSRRWDPATLPLPRPERPKSRAAAAVGAVVALGAVVWLLLVPSMPYLLLGPAAAFTEPAPVWRLAYVPLVIVVAAAAVLDFADARAPRRTRRRIVARLMLNAATLAVLIVLLGEEALFVAAPPAAWPDGVDAAPLVRVIDGGFRLGFFFWSLALGVQSLGEAFSVARTGPAPRPARPQS